MPMSIEYWSSYISYCFLQSASTAYVPIEFSALYWNDNFLIISFHASALFLQSMKTTKQGMGQNLCVCVYVCRYGKVFKTHILGTPIIVSTDPAVNKVVLQNHGNIFIPAYPKSVREIFGEYSILQTNGTLQKKVHALIGGFLRSPQFKTRITKDIEHHVKLTLTSWKDLPLLFVQEETQKVHLFSSLQFILLKIYKKL